MNFHDAKFTAAFGTSAQLPASTGPEVSFCGRSNVGKSSLLNCLMHRKGLAKVSAKPGKTATINFYDVDGADFVDLPGYGFAHVSKSEKSRWSELIDGYFNQTRAFALVVVLVDIRHTKVSKLDIDMVNFVRESGLPFVVALTKADKLSRQGAQKNVASIRRALGLTKSGGTTVKEMSAVAESTTMAATGTSTTLGTNVTTDAQKAGESNDAHCLGVIPISSQTGMNVDKLRSVIERAVDFPEEM